ncbi:AraC family transcriptional regulator [Lachnospiraceae bacterium ZAX-1]
MDQIRKPLPGKEKQRGYLEQRFRLFHLKDKTNQEFEFHYHNFNKIIIFLSGHVTYLVEGKAYYLQPWDILLVNNHDIHKPIIDPNSTYERIIIWLQHDFMALSQDESCDLSACFLTATQKSFHLMRLAPPLQTQIQSILFSLTESLQSNEFGSNVLSNTYFLQLMVYVNRIFANSHLERDPTASKYDKQIAELLAYINLNLNLDLSNQSLAEKFFLSKYYLMHKFKKETGYTLHNYIQQKRLLRAADLIRQGSPIQKAANQCGFQDYSTFLRAFQKMFHTSPREL